MKNKESIFDYSRTIALVDGIYAIVMTLLVLTLDTPSVPVNQLPAAILGDMDIFITYVISFIILGIFWISHQKLFYRIEKIPENYIWMNICAMIFIALIPFALDLSVDYNTSIIGMIIFHIIMLLCGVTNYILWRYAYAKKLLKKEFMDEDYNKLAGMMMPIASLVGILLSFFVPTWTPLVYLLIPISLRFLENHYK